MGRQCRRYKLRGVARIFEWGDETPKASGREAEGTERVGLGRGVPLPWGWVWGSPLPRKFLEFNPQKTTFYSIFYTLEQA